MLRRQGTTRKKSAKTLPWPRRAHIFEVGPRDGLQAEKKILSLEEKLHLVEGLMASGLEDIEVGSFVRADRIPQLSDTIELMQLLKSRVGLKVNEKERTRFWAFIPNMKGLEAAINTGIIDGASFFVAVSDTFAQRNVNRSIADLMKELPELLRVAKRNRLKTRVYLSTIADCPYEGLIKSSRTVQMAYKLFKIGAGEVVLSDTTGAAHPRGVREILLGLKGRVPADSIAMHLHNTRGLALANILQSLEFGVQRFDSSVAGMGGCPYAPGASGNLATEDLVHLLSSMGLRPGVDLGRLAKVGFWCEKTLGRRLESRILRTLENADSQLDGATP